MNAHARSKATNGPAVRPAVNTVMAIETPTAKPIDDPVRSAALAVANRALGTSRRPREANVANEHATPTERNIWAGSTVVTQEDSIVTLKYSQAGQQAAERQPITTRVRWPTRSAMDPTGPPMSAAIAGPGTTPKPAASADQPQSSWRVSVLNRITAMNADEKKVWPTAA